MYVLFVISSRDAMIVLDTFMGCCFSLLCFDELLSIVNGPHNIVVACLLHHMRIKSTLVHSLHLIVAVSGLTLTTCVDARKVVVGRRPFRSWRLLRNNLVDRSIISA